MEQFTRLVSLSQAQQPPSSPRSLLLAVPLLLLESHWDNIDVIDAPRPRMMNGRVRSGNIESSTYGILKPMDEKNARSTSPSRPT
jgi:hypothetical protein